MRKVVFLTITLMMSVMVFAQKPQPESVTVGRENLPGFSMAFVDMSESDVEGAMRQRLETQSGMKSTRSNGFVSYLNQPFPEFGPASYDIYVKATKNGNRKSNVTYLYFVVTKGNMNPVTSSSDPQVVQNIESFLNGFVPYAKAYSTQTKINDLNKQLSKQEKEYQSLQSRQEKLQKQSEDLKKKMEDNQNQIIQTRNEIDSRTQTMRQYQY